MDITPAPGPAATRKDPGVRTETLDTEARKAAKDFESVFLAQAMDEMMRTVDVGDFGGGHAEETWRSFLSRAFAEEIAESGTTGIARSIEGTISAYRARTGETG